MKKTAKALSVRQPWAMLICAGFKDIENRNWKTNHRGALYIHAGKAFDWNALEWLKRIKGARELVVDYFGIKTEGFQQVITTHKDEFGAVVGCVYLRGCSEKHNSIWAMPEARYYWEVETFHQYYKPVKMAGKLGLFRFSYEDIIKKTTNGEAE